MSYIDTDAVKKIMMVPWGNRPASHRQRVASAIGRAYAAANMSDPHTYSRVVSRLLNNVAEPRDYGVEYDAEKAIGSGGSPKIEAKYAV